MGITHSALRSCCQPPPAWPRSSAQSGLSFAELFTSSPLPQAFDAYLRELTSKLGRRVEDLEDVKALVAVLREVWSCSRCCSLLTAVVTAARCAGSCQCSREFVATLPLLHTCAAVR